MSAYVRIHGIPCPRCRGERCDLCTNTYGTTDGTVSVAVNHEQMAHWIETGQQPGAIDPKPESVATDKCESCLHAPASDFSPGDVCAAEQEMRLGLHDCSRYSYDWRG